MSDEINQGHEDDVDNRRKWHVDKRINIGHLLTTATLAIGVFVWANKMDSRITVLEVQQTNQSIISVEIKQQLKYMDTKLDRLIERRP